MINKIEKPLNEVDFGIECCSVTPIIMWSKYYGDFVLYRIKCPKCGKTNYFKITYDETEWEKS